MDNKFSVIICDCGLDNGYIFKNFFACNALRGHPIIMFLSDKIVTDNRTIDDQLYGSGYLRGDEINLNWSESIPMDQRRLVLTFDSQRLQSALGRIRKKDNARISVSQIRDPSDPHNYSGPNSSDEFIIFVSCGIAGDGREGIKSIAANRVANEKLTEIKYPNRLYSSLLVIPIKQFRSMIDSFTKCKKENIRIFFYTNHSVIGGKEMKGRPGIVFSTEGTSHSGRIFEKFGEVPEDETLQNVIPSIQLKMEEPSIVRNGAPLLDIGKLANVNEYVFNADKTCHFSKLASMHNEGNVCIEYQRYRHLYVTHRFGAFGKQKFCLWNAHTKFDEPR